MAPKNQKDQPTTDQLKEELGQEIRDMLGQYTTDLEQRLAAAIGRQVGDVVAAEMQRLGFTAKNPKQEPRARAPESDSSTDDGDSDSSDSDRSSRSSRQCKGRGLMNAQQRASEVYRQQQGHGSDSRLNPLSNSAPPASPVVRHSTSTVSESVAAGRQQRTGLCCFNCGEPGHCLAECTQPEKRNLLAEIPAPTAEPVEDTDPVYDTDGEQGELVAGDLPPLSPQYGTPVMMLGTSWGQQSPYQGVQAPWPVTPGMQQVGNETNNTVARNAQETNQLQLQNTTFPQQVLPMQHQQGSAVVLSQLSGQEGVPRLTYIPQGTADVGDKGTAGVTINQGPVGTGNNQGVVGENASQPGQHVHATNDRRFILYQNRVPGNNTAGANLDDPHIPQGSGVVVADPQIVSPHQTLEENREEQ
ncbi:OLC1v1009223C1 [Oldenlandia corymbosa var. corymbosa]|uniref:OLC1v1009223C1 n=1 Tax=Oldenlandia corymbosa var. corymbosa TaxID=529605 RepID=A0AAV1DNI7_OLDCO|nr:OLC1v1009223C1 [Oldenlandia corymbosa var. corymbosa]